jgi:hypothetical protein
MKYRLVQDEDCHWYCIPVSLVTKFKDALYSESEDFIEQFGEYRVDSPKAIEFEKPGW